MSITTLICRSGACAFEQIRQLIKYLYVLLVAVTLISLASAGSEPVIGLQIAATMLSTQMELHVMPPLVRSWLQEQFASLVVSLATCSELLLEFLL